jgi:hypothetical protein
MAKRELIDTGTDKRYVRRDERGRFVRADDVGRSPTANRRTTAKDVPKKGPARTSRFGNRPLGLSVAVVAGLIAITAGAVLTSATLRRGGTR